MKRFLFLFSDTGGGHRASAQAVKGELERLYGDQQSVEMVDIFVALGQWPFRRFPEWYPTAVGLNGIPWGMGFHLSNDVGLMKTMSKLVWPYARTALCNVLHAHPADVVVSFHPIPNYSVSLGLAQLHEPTPLAIVVVDLVTTHASWFTPGPDMYLVPTAAARRRALRCGILPSKVHIRGMPTRRSFVTAMGLPKQEARQRLGLAPDRDIVLVTGGGDGMGPLQQVVHALAYTLADRADIVVITGKNSALQAALGGRGDGAAIDDPACKKRASPARHTKLAGRAGPLPPSVHIEGFVDNMEIWMRAADILVTKAGPNTVAEAFIAGLPIVLYTALPGQEEGNVSYVVENGAGIWAPTPRQVSRAVAHLLTDVEEHRTMAERSRTMATPHATEDIAHDLWSLTRRDVSPLRSNLKRSHERHRCPPDARAGDH